MQGSERLLAVLRVFKDQRRGGVRSQNVRDGNQLRGFLCARPVVFVGDRHQTRQDHKHAARKQGCQHEFATERQGVSAHSAFPNLSNCGLTRRPAEYAADGLISKRTRLSSR